MNGYIKLFRQMTEWEWYTDADTMRVFIHLLLKANHKEHCWKGMTVHRGECIVGRKELAAELKISEQRVRTALLHLKSTNEITIKSTNKFSLITIEKWALYQLDDGGATSKSTNNPTINQPATNQQLTTNNNERKKKRKEELERDIERDLLKDQHDMFAPIKSMLAAGAQEVAHEQCRADRQTYKRS